MALKCPSCGSGESKVSFTNPNFTWKGKPLQLRARTCKRCGKLYYSKEEVIAGTTSKPRLDEEPENLEPAEIVDPPVSEDLEPEIPDVSVPDVGSDPDAEEQPVAPPPPPKKDQNVSKYAQKLPKAPGVSPTLNKTAVPAPNPYVSRK